MGSDVDDRPATNRTHLALKENGRKDSATGNLQPDIEVLKTIRVGKRWSGAARIGFVALLIAVGSGIYGAVKQYFQPTSPLYLTETCHRGDLVVTVSATGTLEPTNLVEIGCEISGTIHTVEVDVNDPVREGDVLLTLDTEQLEAQVAKSRASLAVRRAELQHAEATLLQSQRDLSRLEQLQHDRAVAEQEVDTARATFARAESMVASSKAQIMVAQATLDGDLSKLQKSRVFAPIDGIVLTRSVEPGQTIAVTLQTPVLLTICEDLRKMELKVDVDEADVGKVREGQAATFTVDAYPDEQFVAKITSLRFASRRIQDVVTYEAVLEVANEQLKLRPGMTAVADIITSKIQNALLVSNAALRFAPDGEALDTSVEGTKSPTPQVWLLEKEKTVSIPVKTGPTDGRLTEIKSGELEEGMPLVVDVNP